MTHEQYIKLDQISHVLQRPDTYVGSKRTRIIEDFVFTDEGKIEKSKVNVSPAFLRVFIEPLSNCIDNVARSRKARKPMTRIDIHINKKTGKTVFWNNGAFIPIVKNKKEKCYNHSLIFGQLLTSSNYDDTEDREDISGRNGLGIKCFSRGTKVILWNGSIKTVEKLLPTDILIGEDGTPRKILGLSQGNGKLYQIKQSRGATYITNGEHTLSLKMPDHRVVFWNHTRNSWVILWWNRKKQCIKRKSISIGSYEKIECKECNVLLTNILRHYKRIHPNIPIPKYPRKNPRKNTPRHTRM